MEKKLSRLMDYQKYAGNSKLAAIIDEVEERYPDTEKAELSDDELDMIAAAGRPDLAKLFPPNRNNQQEK
ncbi:MULTISPECIES: hypothetical protein [unclassified Butyrivibrio]|uniref:hypothetical protein n=1 Tax=unclassified Butyrivibrio TaxID=2639466 RepID=UPI0003B6F2DC|nr:MULTISPECIES: hypothetical protein [unclassified Butyrivibrio]MDC7292298.1 hypothetical protein [Butyrivibrio sp. DSM 10294]